LHLQVRRRQLALSTRHRASVGAVDAAYAATRSKWWSVVVMLHLSLLPRFSTARLQLARQDTDQMEPR